MSLPHHARVLVATDYQAASYAEFWAAEEVVEETYPQLGIDTVRTLVTRAHHTPRHAAAQLFVTRTGFITHEAQNALLKVLEEPPATTRFLFVIPPTCRLLATIRSRVEVFTAAAVETTDAVSAFLLATPAARVGEIERRLKDKDQAWAEQLQLGLLKRFATGELPATSAELVRAVERLNTRGAMNKWLLEDIALRLPQDK